MHRKFDDSFKIMAVELSIMKGSVSEVAKELDSDIKHYRSSMTGGMMYCKMCIIDRPTIKNMKILPLTLDSLTKQEKQEFFKDYPFEKFYTLHKKWM